MTGSIGEAAPRASAGWLPTILEESVLDMTRDETLREALRRAKRKFAKKPGVAYGVCLCPEMDDDGDAIDCGADCEERRVRKRWKRYYKRLRSEGS